MKIQQLLLLVLFACIGMRSNAIAGTSTSDSYCTGTEARKLHVAMYPFIPDRDGAAAWIKRKFEAGCPGLTLSITFNDSYYSNDEKAKDGVLYEDADIYEVDSVFFSDFVAAGIVQPFPQSLITSTGPTVPFAQTSGQAAGVTYGIPHWLCSDFLIYRTDEPDLAAIASPSDAAKKFGAVGPSNGLLMDIKGASTLGELYLSTLVAHYGLPSALNDRYLDPANLDSYAMNVLKEFVEMEPPGFGRDKGYHNQTGFYSAQFARRSGGAFVGYSEDTYYMLSELTNSPWCKTNKCIAASEIDVARWPFADEVGKPVAWVDMYMLNKQLSGNTLSDAEAFIKFMMQVPTYEALLVPKGTIPRYLLPARDDLYSDVALLNSAPLYPKFRKLIDQAVPVTDKALNNRLRTLGSAIDAQLPPKH